MGFGHWQGGIPLSKPNARRPAKSNADRLLGGPGPQVDGPNRADGFPDSGGDAMLKINIFADPLVANGLPGNRVSVFLRLTKGSPYANLYQPPRW